MQANGFGTLENSVSILVNDIWGSPDWADWYEDSLQLNIHEKLRIEIGLTGLGGSAAYLERSDHVQLFAGAPMYVMDVSMHKDLTFVAQLALDIFYLLEEIRTDRDVAGDSGLSGQIVKVVGPLILFLKITLETRPDSIQREWWGRILDALKHAGVKSIQLDGETLKLN